jgi:hypothetical protein
MRPDLARPSSSFGRRGSRVSRIAWAIVLVVGLAGCGHREGAGEFDFGRLCPGQHPGDTGCCDPGYHMERTICCPPGYHEVSDVEHADWGACLPDETPADADAAPDGGVDAP